MPIRINRLSRPQEPVSPSRNGAIVPVQPVTNPGAIGVNLTGQAAKTAEDIYQQERGREITTRVREADIQMRRANNAVLDDYRSLSGKDAVEARARVAARLRQNSESILQGIGDEEVREPVRLQGLALEAAGLDDMQAHYQRENKRWQEDTALARAEVGIDSAARAAIAGNADRASKERSSFEDSIRSLGKMRGLDAARVEVMLRDSTTILHSTVVDGMLANGDVAGASEYFANVPQGEVSSDAADNIKLKLAQARRNAAQEVVENQAGAYAAKLFDSGRTQGQSRAQIERDVEAGTITRQVGDNAWIRIKDFHEERWQERQRAKAETLDFLGQTFTKDDTATVENLPQDVREDLERRGLYGKAVEVEWDVRAKRLAAALAANPDSSLEMNRDVRTMTGLRSLIEKLQAQVDGMGAGDAGKDPETKRKREKLEKHIEGLELFLDRVQDRVVYGILRTGTAPTEPLTEPAPVTEESMRKFFESMKKTIYQGGGK